MQIHERERPLTAWLKAHYPDVLGDFEQYLGENSNEVYFLDLWMWLHREYPDIWSEYARSLKAVIQAAKTLFADIREALQKFDHIVEANPCGVPSLGSESWVTAQDVTVHVLNWKGWLKKGTRMLPICDDWLERAFEQLSE